MKDGYVSAILDTLYYCKCNLEPELNCVLLYARTFMQGEHKYALVEPAKQAS